RLRLASARLPRPLRMRMRPVTVVNVDTVLEVAQGTVLVVSNVSGDIDVKAWGRPMVRLHAERGGDDRILLEWRGNQLHLRSLGRYGEAGVDYHLTVPRQMALQLTGVDSEIQVNGVDAPVQAQSVKGDVEVSDASGDLDLTSVEGEVRVADARGRVQAGSVNNDVRLDHVSGPVDVQTINGDIQLERLDSERVDASSVNGNVVFASAFQPRGRYQLASHNGDLVVGVPNGAGLDVSVRSYNGTFSSSFPVRLPALKGHHFQFAVGRGGSDLQLESYQGAIQMLKMDEIRRQLDRLRTRMQAHMAPEAPQPPTPEENDK
ncbi:MAG TPA: DUF4097 family beta strand repeat-containing protein, partial [Candidatus Eisenbacteria bacterium]|nr:DUF4097 family beta strand repeat-containing protein [Candidatus Eisenbacteria bacterium]